MANTKGKADHRLREWLSSSAFEGSPSLLAKYLNLSVDTVKGWLYKNKMPKTKQRLQLFLLSGLEKFAPQNKDENALLATVEDDLNEETKRHIERLKESIVETWDLLEFFVLTPNSTSLLVKEIGSEELKAIARMFERFADPCSFAAWQLLRAVERHLTDK